MYSIYHILFNHFPTNNYLDRWGCSVAGQLAFFLTLFTFVINDTANEHEFYAKISVDYIFRSEVNEKYSFPILLRRVCSTKLSSRLGMVTHTCKLSIQEAESGGWS